MASLAFAFSVMLALVTMPVHFIILTAGRSTAFAETHWNAARAFQWPSVPYTLDVLAWDVFFALSVLMAAVALGGRGAVRWVKWLFILSGALALAGLSGIALNDMSFRNIGILGYAVIFPIAAGLLGREFKSANIH
ncbi:hypothetical protein MMA231_02826 [Asticcacaulis sp. MM231]